MRAFFQGLCGKRDWKIGGMGGMGTRKAGVGRGDKRKVKREEEN